jgi:hypothetical protein
MRFLEAVAEIGDLAAQAKEMLRIDQVEARGRRASQHVLADPHQRSALERLDAVLAEPRHMQLDDRARPAVGRRERLVALRADVAVQPGLAIAQDRAGRVTGRRLDGMFDPPPVARRDQELDVDTAERFGIGIVNDRGHGNTSCKSIFVAELVGIRTVTLP